MAVLKDFFFIVPSPLERRSLGLEVNKKLLLRMAI
jgi:hypothetical protein